LKNPTAYKKSLKGEFMRVEEQFMDVLQNIEVAVTSYFKVHPDLTDYAILRVYEALTDCYTAEILKRDPRPVNLSENESELCDTIKNVCEWRLGRNAMPDEPEDELPTANISLSDMVACLKRLQNSVRKWTKHNGRQGYLKFIGDFCI